ncbi:hypothetical protein ACFYVL_08885 [Streptomyces sp. NPDC004111]|uniref:hypothetical protein n=1 Tax=Streptomyces sp. NPDC004111 TaxID=3364690 RepID=UPI0036753EBB
MPRLRIAFAAALVGLASLTACSSRGDISTSAPGAQGGDKPADAAPAATSPITKSLPQADLTKALLGDGETLPGWSLHDDKSVMEGMYCNRAEGDAVPEGWVRGGDASYEYNGSTKHMADADICLFDTAENAHRAYLEWKGTEKTKERPLKPPVGDEGTLVLNPGRSEDYVHAFSHSGRVNIRIKLDGVTGPDPEGARAMLAATLKRLQQLQDGNPATATAVDEQAQTPK